MVVFVTLTIFNVVFLLVAVVALVIVVVANVDVVSVVGFLDIIAFIIDGQMLYHLGRWNMPKHTKCCVVPLRGNITWSCLLLTYHLPGIPHQVQRRNIYAGTFTHQIEFHNVSTRHPVSTGTMTFQHSSAMIRQLRSN